MKTTRCMARVFAGYLSVLTLLVGSISQSAQARPPRSKVAHQGASITRAQARAVALKKYPGEVVGKTALENEEGRWQYSVNVRSGKTLREVMVDARSGKIANVEVTTQAEEANEAKAEAKHSKASHRTTSKTTKG